MFKDITRSDVMNAADDIRKNGIEKNIFNGNQKHWVEFSDGSEFPYKELARRAYRLTNGDELEFTSTKNNRSEFEDRFGLKINKYAEGVNFFSKEELIRFSSISGNPFRKKDELSNQRKKLFWPTFVRSNKWADLLRERLTDYIIENNDRWQTGFTFRKYTWHKIYKPVDEDKLIFFTIGVDGGNNEKEENAKLVIKIDCMREIHGNGETLTKEKIDLFYQFINQYDDRLKIEVLTGMIENFDWASLVDKTYEFIMQREQDYEDLIKHVHQITTNKEVVKENYNSVAISEKPLIIKSLIPENPTFMAGNIDWEKEQRRARNHGLSGESFVRTQCELNPDVFQLGSKIKDLKKQQDGIGYDFLALLESGEEYYLEVKSTTGSIERPFYMSRNEREFLMQHYENYRLIRVYDLNSVLKRGRFYILKGKFLNSNKVRFQPTNYEISINVG